MSEEIMDQAAPEEQGEQTENQQENSSLPEVKEDPTKPSAQTNNALKDMIKELELKVNGKIIKKKIDLNDEEALKREFQIAESNKSGMAKAAEYEKLYQEQMETLKRDPLEYAAKILGLDVEELAAQRLSRAIEERQKSPEQRESEQRSQELDKIRQENEQLKKTAEESRFLQLQEKEATKFKSEMEEALNEFSSLPKNSKLVTDKIIDMMLWAMDQGYQEVRVRDVLPAVEAELIKTLNSHMDALPEDAIEKFIGKKNAERMRLKRISSAQKAPGLNLTQTTAQTESVKVENSKKVGAKEFFKSLK